jgi:alpha-ketoglutarate-dependent taurine dioxygenase
MADRDAGSSPPPGPLAGRPVWTPAELPDRPEWRHELTGDERAALLAVAGRSAGDGERATLDGVPLEHAGAAELPLDALRPRLDRIRDELEHGAGVVRVRGFPTNPDPVGLRAAFWAIAVHLGTPVSQSPEGHRIFSVRDAGFASGDPRARGPNTRKRLSFHTDRSDVIGFLCVKQALEGGENEIAGSMAVYNEILARRPDLLRVLMRPFLYQRHTVDHGNERPWCRQPVFSFEQGHFACCFLRVLIQRAHLDPDLPDLTGEQIEALDYLESVAEEPAMHLRFRQRPGDLLFVNNWTVLHRRTAFVDHADPAEKRHILRIWLSMPNSRPLDPLFADNFGSVAAGAVRGGMPERSTRRSK